MPESEDLIARFEKAGIDFDAIESLAENLAEKKASGRVRARSPEAVERLKAIGGSFNTPTTFKVGDVVRWKDGLKNKRNPSKDVPAVVFAVLETPLFDKDANAGSQYFNEPLDLVIGVFLDDEDDEIARTFHVDSRRFEHHPDFS